MKEIRETVQPAYLATKKLQTAGMTLPDIKKIIDITYTNTAALGIERKNERVKVFSTAN